GGGWGAGEGGGGARWRRDRRAFRVFEGLVVHGGQFSDRRAPRFMALSVLADARPAWTDPEALRPPGRGAASTGWLGRFACNGYVGADPVQRFQYVGLGLLHARRRGADGDDEADPEREAQRDEDGLPHPA